MEAEVVDNSCESIYGWDGEYEKDPVRCYEVRGGLSGSHGMVWHYHGVRTNTTVGDANGAYYCVTAKY